ncbi:F-box protein At1g30790-like [Carica papaya]|uniref:F-box protein At1g30790-like n=1 Tax=Carica papaya TaxID=3649 RepID=UPI000B8CEC2D|nr:F-box protein At1g30790-like [Carica papaya]
MTLSRSPVPPDIILDILIKLPVKSLVRFRCVSKLCASMITAQSFAKHHFILAPKKPPALLIICATRLPLIQAHSFFSADINGGQAIRRMIVPPRLSRYTTHSVNGIVCMDFGLSATICNPSTRESIALPLVCPLKSPLASSTYFCVNSFGFDPVEKLYKVLNSWIVAGEASNYRVPNFVRYCVFTLGSSSISWRVIPGGPPYYPQRESVCINGVIYFRSWVTVSRTSDRVVLVGFNLHNETFEVTQLPEGAGKLADSSSLLKFCGTLGIVDSRIGYDNKVSVWLFQHDSPDKFWVKHSIIFPPYLRKIGGEQDYVVVGTIHTGEVILVPSVLSKHFYVFYYNNEKQKLRRVRIQGLPEYKPLDFFCNGVTVTSYEENVVSFS